MKKVLFLISTLSGGGAEKVLVETVNSLDHNKYQITVQTIFDEGVHKDELSPDILYKSIIPFKKGFLRKLYFALLFKILGCSFVYKFFVHAEYDYEIAFLEGYPTKIISQSTNGRSRKYAWLHIDLNAFPDSVKAYGSEEKESVAYRRFDKIFCVSESVKAELQKKYDIEDNKVGVVYNIINDKAILLAAGEDVTLPISAHPVFVSVGRLVKMKGYERLLRVHQRLINEGMMHSLLIVGDGPDYAILSDYIKKNNLQNTAFLLGYQTNPYKYISRANLFICSSYAEGYSTVVSEAVICGVPVLSTEVSGAREPFDCPRCSFVVSNDESSIYDKLKALIENPDELMVLRHDLEKAKACLNKEALVEKFENQVFFSTDM